MPDDLAKDTVPAPAKPKDAPVPDTPFSERSDGLDPNIDQGLIRFSETRLKARRDENARKKNPAEAIAKRSEGSGSAER